MGLLDSLKGVLGGSGKHTLPVTLDPGEQELDRVVGCTVKGNGASWVGGDLVLTNQRLLFTPLNINDAASLLTYGLTKTGAPGQAAAVVGWMQKQAVQQPVGLDAISEIRAGRGASLLHPPSLVVTLSTGTGLEFGVLATRTSFNGSSANTAARDGFVSKVRSLL
jgi:hypothetical protein